MRIISGEAKGRTLVAPTGQKTRPTQDYVRESLFNILNRQVEDTTVLDLFAGTGALALECISRGAKQAVLVDSDRSACKAVKKNIQTVRCEEKCRLIPRDYHQAVDELTGTGICFDLVFLDPPYRMIETGEICQLLADQGMLCPECLLIIEHKKGCEPVLTDAFLLEQTRKYGDTEISFVRYKGTVEETV